MGRGGRGLAQLPTGGLWWPLRRGRTLRGEDSRQEGRLKGTAVVRVNDKGGWTPPGGRRGSARHRFFQYFFPLRLQILLQPTFHVPKVKHFSYVFPWLEHFRLLTASE